MSFINTKINISLNDENYSFYYSYNEDTTFQDLLEYFAFLMPSLNICQCYYLEAGQDYNGIIFSLSSKIKYYKEFLKELILIRNQDRCIHSIQNFFLNSKKDIISFFQNNVEELGKDIKNKQNEITELKNKLQQLENSISNKVIISQSNTNNLNHLDFYDVIVEIDSIKDINKGWKIYMNQKGKHNYEKFKNEKILKIGVIGNANTGKTLILSKISKICLPSGMSIKTEGLSVKYPDFISHTNRYIALLDSAGFETPVLIERLIDDDKKRELFREKTKEKLITELFLQNYIVNNSDILLVVVDSLSFSEQKLLMKVKKEIERSKRAIKLFIIHNLKTFISKKQVEDYIANTLLKSASFSLEEGSDINTKKGIYFSEIKKNIKDLDVFHLIYANENSEAGKYYNQYTLDFIENSYRLINNLKPFDVIESIKERYIKVYNDIIEKTENNKQLTLNDFHDNLNLIKLKSKEEILLKRCFVDEFGFSNLKTRGFNPKYNIFKKDNKIIIKVEVPGNCSLHSEIEPIAEYNIIKLTGQKRIDLIPAKFEDNIFSIREYGQFYLEIPLNSRLYNLSGDPPFIEEKKGLIIIEYKMAEKPKKGNYDGIDI